LNAVEHFGGAAFAAPPLFFEKSLLFQPIPL